MQTDACAASIETPGSCHVAQLSLPKAGRAKDAEAAVPPVYTRGQVTFSPLTRERHLLEALTN